MRRISVAALCVCTVLTAGCVGKLRTLPNREVTAVDGALTGFTYSLPKVRYEVKLRRSLAECPGEVVANNPTALKFAISAEATPTVLAGESYTIDYARLPGWLRTASFEGMLYGNGTLKKIGVAAEDKTAETISDVAKTAFSVATVLGLSSGRPLTTAVVPSQIVQCTPEALKDVARARKNESDLKAQTELLKTYETAADRLRAAGAARALDAKGKAAFLTLIDDIGKAEAEIARLNNEEAELADRLGVTETIVWEGGATHPNLNQSYALSPAQAEKLAALLVFKATPSGYPTDDAEARRQAIMKPC